MTLVGSLGLGSSEAMAAGAVLYISMRNSGSSQGRIEEFAILVFDDRIVHAIDQKNRWTISRDMFLQRKQILLVAIELAIPTEKPSTRTTMGE